MICVGSQALVASGGSIWLIDPETGEYSLKVRIPATTIKDIAESNGFLYVLADERSIFKCGSQDGKLPLKVLRHYVLPQEDGKASIAKKIYIDETGIIWTATQTGLQMLDPDDGETCLLRSDLLYPYSLPNSSVWSIYEDPDGGVWVGTYGGKLAYHTFRDNDVNYIKATPGSLSHRIVSCFEEDKDGNLWIGTEGGGLNLWDRKHDTFRHFTDDNASGLTSSMIKKISHDSKGRLLVSSFNGGIKMLTGDPFSKGHTPYFTDLGITDPKSGKSLTVYGFEEEGDRGIWAADPDNELMFKDFKTGKTEIARPLDDYGNPVAMHVETLFHDPEGKLWLVTHNGAYVIDSATLRILRHWEMEDSTYPVNHLCSGIISSGGDVWLGTKGGGLNIIRGAFAGSRHSSHRTQDGPVYTSFQDCKGNSLRGLTIFGIVEDLPTGDIWLSTNGGLWRWNAAEDLLEESKIDVPSHCGAYYVRSCYRTSRGELIFGGTDGFIFFNPARILQNDLRPRVWFTGLRIGNRPALPDAEDSPISASITTMSGNAKPIVLSHKQSNFEVFFASSSYLHSERNLYEYRMTGLGNGWTRLPPGQKMVQFFNLPAGKYRLELRTANSDGIWGDHISTLTFRVKPSPWLSVWAQLIYLVFAAGIIWFVWRYLTDRKMYEHRLQLEKIKEKNQEELIAARVKFFTDISHDLKTPLSLIVDPLKRLGQMISDKDPAYKYVRTIERSTVKIRHMISQLLQFREIESQKITFNRQSGELVRFLESQFSLFETYAGRKNIETDFRSDWHSLWADFDHDVIEKIFMNLFSNAIKYTPENGYVGVHIRPADTQEAVSLPQLAPDGKDGTEIVSVVVTNTGTEIPEAKRESIFESFKRLEEGSQPEFESSTGLGLAIVRELVNETGGRISLCSGEGKVTFTVTLPLARAEAPEQVSGTGRPVDDHTSSSYSYTLSEIDSLNAEAEEEEPEAKGTRKSCDIVVIEDETSMRKYLKSSLSENYNVYTASTGDEGISRAAKVCPQVIITDLAMPGTDGFAVCRALRADIKTSHIPIIMLSGAGNEGNNRVKALENGANVFIDKPFSMDFLISQIESLIRSQKEMKELYSKRWIAEPAKVTISSMDEKLLKRAMENIEKNMDNEAYSVEDFVGDMAIGRTILYQKINEITGMSIKEFIMDIRLKRACHLLRESDLTISEVSAMTGFANPKYFSICFKRHFDITPKDFKHGAGVQEASQAE